MVTVVAPPDAPARVLSRGQLTRQRLDHVDAMRPVKQMGVVGTHTTIFFTPAGSGLGAGSILMLLHVTREAFLFISACMLTYSYYDLKRNDLRRFWRRRLVTVGIPYVCWTLIYFFVGLHGSGRTAVADLRHLAFIGATGYYQLYFLIVLLQFYLLFPLFLWLLRRTARHHGALLLASFGIQIAYIGVMRWAVLPQGLRGFSATREIMSYQFYLVAGSLAAVHYKEFDAWVRRHRPHILVALAVTTTIAEVWYFVQGTHTWQLGSGIASDPFQPIVIPYNIAAILAIYLIGVSLVSPARSDRTVKLAHRGSDDSYGVYLAQVLFIDALMWLGWRQVNNVIPWPILLVISVVLVFFLCCVLTEVLARTPFAEALTGRKEEPWNALVPGWVRRGRTASAPKDAPDAPPPDTLVVQDPI